MEDRQQRIFLAILMSLGIWMAFNYFFFPPVEKKIVQKPQSPQTQDEVQSKPDEIKIVNDAKIEPIKNSTPNQINPQDIKNII